MNVYLWLLSFLYIHKFDARHVLATISVIDKGIFPLEKDSVAIQFYLNLENRHVSRACSVIAWPRECCLNPNESDYTCMHVYGHYQGVIKEKDRDTLIFVLPSVYQHDLYGSCNFNVVHKCNYMKKPKKDTVEIILDTRLRRKTADDLFDSYIGRRNPKSCKNVDDNSLNNCNAADCDQKYLGAKPYFNKEMRKCTEVISCISDMTKALPNSVYLPNTNFCQEYDHPLTLADIYAISTRMGVVTEKPKQYKPEDLVELNPNCSTISQNLLLLRDMLNGKLCKMTGGSDYGKCCRIAIFNILKFITTTVLAILALIFILALISWCWVQWSTGEISDFFYRCRCKWTRSKLSGRRLMKEIVKEQSTYSVINNNVKNELLRDVIVRDIPLELRDSSVNLCKLINDDVKKKRRYRRSALGSQISLKREHDTTGPSSRDAEEKDASTSKK